jgi:hypothetical protein
MVCVGVSAEQFYWDQSINQSINTKGDILHKL